LIKRKSALHSNKSYASAAPRPYFVVSSTIGASGQSMAIGREEVELLGDAFLNILRAVFFF
jgi:hypothetical protein